jgi:hypothetical protein
MLVNSDRTVRHRTNQPSLLEDIKWFLIVGIQQIVPSYLDLQLSNLTKPD